MKSLCASILLAVLLLSTALSDAAEKPWIEVRSPHFRVLTNGSAGDARHVAEEFEQMRYVFTSRFPNIRLDSGAPLTIFAARDEDTAKALEPAMWKVMGSSLAGEFNTGWEKQYAMVRLDNGGISFGRISSGRGSPEEQTRTTAYHEYTHSVLRMNSHWLPSWLNEGEAEFYAYTRFEQNKIYIGAPSNRIYSLQKETPIPVEALIGERPGYQFNTSMFYAESWALVHYLTYGPGMEGGKKLDQFFALLQQGVPQKRAFAQIFGDFDKIDKALQSYMRQPTFATTIIKDSPQLDDKAFTTRTLTVAETEAELGAFHLWTRDISDAKPLLEQAVKDDPKLGIAHEGMGFVRFAEGKDAEAVTEFSQAYAADNTLYLSLFARTMLSPLPTSDSIADMNTFGQLMGKILQINPQFAPAYVQLARLAIREDDLKSALTMAQRAEDLQPSLAGYHLMSGQITLRLGNGTSAADDAKFVADRWHGPDHNEAVELWNLVPPTQRPAGEALTFEFPKDTQLVSGTVKSVTCADQDQGWAFTIMHDGQPLAFHRKGGFPTGYSDTLWYGRDHFSLCHHLEGQRAIVHYHPASDSSYAGDIAEIEIRDDLPFSSPAGKPAASTANNK
jgi:tetratricopeptide (TPR) repeat protein